MKAPQVENTTHECSEWEKVPKHLFDPRVKRAAQPLQVTGIVQIAHPTCKKKASTEAALKNSGAEAERAAERSNPCSVTR